MGVMHFVNTFNTGMHTEIRTRLLLHTCGAIKVFFLFILHIFKSKAEERYGYDVCLVVSWICFIN